HADGGDGRLRVQAGAALRENVEKLMDGWDLQDPNPGEYTLTLDAIARAAPIFEAQRLDAGLVEAGDELPGPLRLLHTALEVDAYGPTVQTAVLDLANMGYTGTVLNLLREAPPENGAAREIIREVTAPARVRQYLSLPDVDETALEVLAGFLGEGAVPLFLDALAQSESRSVRRKVFDRLGRMGAAVGDELLLRLAAEDRWFVIRNYLALLRSQPHAAEKVDPIPFLHHPEPQVRREALPLALARPGMRDRALALALADPDERNCRVGLTELPVPVPETLVPTLLRRVVQAPRDASLRALGLRGLRGMRTPLVREAALATASRGRTLVGKARLAEPDPAVLEALRLLAVDWPEDGEARAVVETAARSRTPEIREAVTGGGE
ncbi:MAG TPA: HEAT repeat domain-containing protein, partial [Longimicrobiales bacterium]|nr:HEAT repeat domain-containing protein [Longimicrobiales bacterium]